MAIVLPNGPELAVCVMSVISRWCAVPIAANFSTPELIADFKNCQVQALICMEDAGQAIAAAQATGIALFSLTPSRETCGLFSLNVVSPASQTVSSGGGYGYIRCPTPQFQFKHSEIVMILQTSGE